MEEPDASAAARFRKAVEVSVHPEDQQGVLHFYATESLLQLYAAGQGETSLEYRTLRGDTFIWVSASINLLKDPASGDLLAFGYLTDITERRQREAELVYKSERDFLTKLCARIRSIRMVHPRYSGVSVSIGVAIAPEHGDSFEELYAKADVALYHAKQGGRDRFVIYGGE